MANELKMMTGDEVMKAAEALPDGVYFGDPLTPDIVAAIVNRRAGSDAVPEVSDDLIREWAKRHDLPWTLETWREIWSDAASLHLLAAAPQPPAPEIEKTDRENENGTSLISLSRSGNSPKEAPGVGASSIAEMPENDHKWMEITAPDGFFNVVRNTNTQRDFYRGCGYTIRELTYADPEPAPVDEAAEEIRDWVEDIPHENGNYQCRCAACGELFRGHKRRIECKRCATKLIKAKLKQPFAVKEAPELPELPVALTWIAYAGKLLKIFTADQMREYARAALAAARPAQVDEAADKKGGAA